MCLGKHHFYILLRDLNFWKVRRNSFSADGQKNGFWLSWAINKVERYSVKKKWENIFLKNNSVRV